MKNTQKGRIGVGVKTVADLRKALAGLPDEMPVGGIGHFGEYLELISCGVETVRYIRMEDGIIGDIFQITTESAGECPS